MSRSRELASKLFGPQGGSAFLLVHALAPCLDKFRYEFVPDAEYAGIADTDVQRAMQIYWREILGRAHWCASTSLIRSDRWLDGALRSYEGNNLLSLSACYRGFLEA